MNFVLNIMTFAPGKHQSQWLQPLYMFEVITKAMYILLILYFPIPHNSLFVPQVWHKPLMSNAHGISAYSISNTIVYAKFGGQTE